MTGRPPRIVPGALLGALLGRYWWGWIRMSQLGCSSNFRWGFRIQVWGDDNSETWIDVVCCYDLWKNGTSAISNLTHAHYW